MVLLRTSQPLQGVYIRIRNLNKGTQTDGAGKFNIKVPAETDLKVEVSYVGKTTRIYNLRLKPNEIRQLNAELEDDVKESTEIQITGKRDLREQVSVVTIDPGIRRSCLSPFGDFNKVIATMPGVVSNNELSSTYSVRGGNYNENLVYVNNIEIYRPFLVSSGQQEGLSFVNPDMVKSVEFSPADFRHGMATSWPRFSMFVLNPKKFGGSVSLGILAQTASIEGADSSGRV